MRKGAPVVVRHPSDVNADHDVIQQARNLALFPVSGRRPAVVHRTRPVLDVAGPHHGQSLVAALCRALGHGDANVRVHGRVDLDHLVRIGAVKRSPVSGHALPSVDEHPLDRAVKLDARVVSAPLDLRAILEPQRRVVVEVVEVVEIENRVVSRHEDVRRTRDGDILIIPVQFHRAAVEFDRPGERVDLAAAAACEGARAVLQEPHKVLVAAPCGRGVVGEGAGVGDDVIACGQFDRRVVDCHARARRDDVLPED